VDSYRSIDVKETGDDSWNEDQYDEPSTGNSPMSSASTRHRVVKKKTSTKTPKAKDQGEEGEITEGKHGYET
jgi:hypothetical protein